MKKPITTLLLLLIGFTVFSQETTKQKEVGISFYSLNSFGLSYKFGKPNSLWRINTLFASGRNNSRDSDSINSGFSTFDVGFSFGKEFRKAITDKLELRYGADLGFSVRQSANESSERRFNTNFEFERELLTYTPRINLVIGLNYLINDHIIIGAELLPGFSYTMGTEKEKRNGVETEFDITEINYGFSNYSALLTLGYRF